MCQTNIGDKKKVEKEKFINVKKVITEVEEKMKKWKIKDEEQNINPELKYDNYFSENNINKNIYVNPTKNRMSNHIGNIEKKPVQEEKSASKSIIF